MDCCMLPLEFVTPALAITNVNASPSLNTCMFQSSLDVSPVRFVQWAVLLCLLTGVKPASHLEKLTQGRSLNIRKGKLEGLVSTSISSQPNYVKALSLGAK